MSKKIPSLPAALEALLFMYGEPITLKKIAAILKQDESAIQDALKQLETRLQNDDCGLELVQLNSAYQLTTKPHFHQLLESLTKAEFEENLTPATLETLSIVIYAGPVSRADVEYIRGVNSSFILRALLMRGLIDRSIDPKRANAYLYSTSIDFLKRLGVKNVEALPDYHAYNSLVKKLYEETKTVSTNVPDQTQSE